MFHLNIYCTLSFATGFVGYQSIHSCFRLGLYLLNILDYQQDQDSSPKAEIWI